MKFSMDTRTDQEIMDRIQNLSKSFRGRRVKVFQDPVTKAKLEEIGTIRSIELSRTENDDAPFFFANVQFSDGIFERRVSEEDVI